MSDVTLRDYLEAILDEREKRTTQLERDAKDALEKASVALERRLDLLNEFRAQAAEEAQKYALRLELDQVRKDLDAIRADHIPRSEMAALKSRVDIQTGGRSMLVSVIGVMLAIAAIAVALLH